MVMLAAVCWPAANVEAQCAPPTNFTVTNVTTTSAHVSWTESTSTNVQQYTLYRSIVPVTDFNTHTNWDWSAGGYVGYPSEDWTDLEPNTTYYCYLQTTCTGYVLSDVVSYTFTTPDGCKRPVVTLSEHFLSPNEIFFDFKNPNFHSGDSYTLEIAQGLKSTFNLNNPSSYSSAWYFNETDSVHYNGVINQGLEPGTDYSLAMRVNCINGTDTSWSDWTKVMHKRTDCEGVALPYAEDFDSYTGFISTNQYSPNNYPDITYPDCWNFFNLSEYRYLKPQAFLTSSNTLAKSGNGLVLYSTPETPVYAMLPKFTGANGDPLELSFYYSYMNGNLSGTLTVGYITSDNGYDFDPNYSFVAVDSCPVTTGMTLSNLTINNLPDNARLAFRFTAAEGNYGVVIDEVTITSLCMTVALPYTENFDSYTQGVSSNYLVPSSYPDVTLPDCWTFLNRSMSPFNNGANPPYVYIGQFANYTISGKSLLFRASPNIPIFVALPLFEKDIHNLKLSFYYRNESSNDGNLIVGYMTDPSDASTFVELRGLDKVTTMTLAEVTFGGVPAGVESAHIAFKSSTAYIGHYLSIDDVTVEYIPCPGIATLPFTEDFDSYTGYTSSTAASNNLPECWNYLNAATSTSFSGYPIVYQNSSFASTGSNSLRFDTYNHETFDDQIAILPQIDITTHPINTLRLSFDARCNDYVFTAVVGVISNPADKNTFVPVDTFSTVAGSYKHYEFPFSHYTGSGSYIAIMAPKSATTTTNPGFIDNIMVDVLPSCITPMNLTASNITPSSITLSWTEMGTATAWDIEYGPIGFTQGNGTTVTVTSNSYTVTGLIPTTGYDFYVRANCGGNNVSNYTNRLSVSTECGYLNLPYVENFDSYDATVSYLMANLPYCWSRINSGTSFNGMPNIQAQAPIYFGHAASGKNFLQFYTSTSTSCDDQYVVLPQIDVSSYPMNTLQLFFDASSAYTNNSNYTFKLMVGVMTNPTDRTTFVVVDSIVPASNTYATYNVSFSNYDGTGSYIALMAPKPVSGNNYGFVDNLEVNAHCAPVVVDATHSFTDDFESDLCWQLINGDRPNAWARGEAVNHGGSKALYISNDGGTTNAYNTNSYNSVVYASKLFSLEAGQYDFSYDWMCTGESCCDYLRVALVPGLQELTASTYPPSGLSGTSLPDGWIALDGGKKLNGSGIWTEQQPLNVNITEAGIYTVVFVWRNDGSGGSNPPAAIDNFNVTKAACPSPYNLTVSDITSTTAALQFSTYGQSSFTYALAKANDFDVTNSSQWHTLTSTSTTLAGLEPFTRYTVAVKSSCPDNSTTNHWSEPVSFTTALDCGSRASRQFAIGTHTSQNASYPFYSLASSSGNQGASWQIFTADEILDGSEFAGAIKGIAWKSSQNASIPFQIYMANTSKDAFADAADTVSRATMTKVYDGTMDFAAGEWTDIAFTTPFEYDATANLLIMVYRPTLALSQSVYFDYSACDGDKTIYYSGAESLETGYGTSKRNNTRFTMCVTEATECDPVTTLPFTDDFESDQCWQLINGTNTNAWVWDSATNNGGSKALYISNDGGTTNAYTTTAPSMVYAAKPFSLSAGEYAVRYDWKAEGESAYDYMRVALVPTSETLEAGTSSPFDVNTLPTSWIALDGGTKLNQIQEWTTIEVDNITVPEDGNYNVVFAWWNDNSVGTNPPAAVDNFSIRRTTCSSPRNLAVQNITPSSATVQFTHSGEATEFTYVLAETVNFNMTDTTQYHTTHSLSNTVTNLTPNTSYTVAVRTNCGDEEHSIWSAPYTFMTPCYPVTILPFTENFDAHAGATITSVATNNLPYCWSYLNTGTSTSYTGYPIIYADASYAASGSNALRFYLYNSNNFDNQMAILPQIDPTLYPVNNLQLSFDAKSHNSYKFTVVVGVIANPSDKTTFVPIDTIMTTSDTYTNYKFPFSQYTGPEGFIAVMAPRPTSNSSYNAGYIDNIVVDVWTCPKPKYVTASSSTETSIDLAWTEMGNASAWDIEYGPKGFAQGSGTMLTGVTSNPYTITGLTHSTGYDFYVRANCGGGDVSMFSTVCTAGTECLPISNLPFTENFDQYPGSSTWGLAFSNLPHCWNNITTSDISSYSGYPIIYSSSSSALSGSNSLQFDVSENYDDQIAILPQIDITTLPINTLQLSFDARNSSNQLTIIVGVMTAPTDKTTFVPVDTLTTTLSAYKHYDIPFSHYTGSGSYIAIMAPKPTTGDNTGNIDNLVLDLLPSCIIPTDVNASNITPNSITISWTEMGTATSWNIEYGPIGFTQGHGTTVTVNSNSYSATGLTPSTGYDFYVRANCGNGDFSQYTNRFSASTICGYLSMPYAENFDAYDANTAYVIANLPYCWSRINSGDIYEGLPIIYNSNTYAASSSNSLRFHTSANTSYDDQIAVLPQINNNSYPINTLQLSLDACMYAEYPDYIFKLMVGVMTDPTDRTTFEIVDSIVPAATTYATYTVPLSSYTGSGSYIALMAKKPASGYNTGFIDNLEVTTCAKPTIVIASNPTETSIDLAWIETSGATAWEIEYGPAGFTPGDANSNTVTATSTPYTLANLTPGTLYDIYVRSDCGGDHSLWISTQAHTQICDSSDQCEYTFALNDAYGDGWNGGYLLVKQNGITMAKVTMSSGFKATKTVSLCNNIPAELEWHSASYDNEVSFTMSNPFGDILYSDSIPAAGTLFTFTTSCIEVCPKPQNLNAENATGTSMDLAWDEMGSATSWEVAYGPAGFTPGDANSNTVTATSNPYTLANLTPLTTYDIYVRSDCGSGDYSRWSNVYTVTTACGKITELPFLENFDAHAGATSTSVAANNLPYCWSNYNTGTGTSCSGYPIIYASATYAASGNNAMRFYTYTPSVSYSDQTAILPAIDANTFPTNTLQLTFDARQNDSSYPFTLVVGVMSDPTDISTFTAVQTVTVSSTTYNTFDVPLTSYTGAGEYIAIKAPQPTSGYNRGYVDNIFVDVAPLCSKPTNVIASNIMATSADINWQLGGDETAWEVVVVPAGASVTTGSPVLVSTHPYTLTNLSDSTSYDVYVRADCGTGADFSFWSKKCTFTTFPLCTSPTDVLVSQVTGTSALVSWTPAIFGATGYTVSYSKSGTNNWISQTVTGDCYMLSGLTPETAYTVSVASECNEGNAPVVTQTFTTSCLYSDNIQIGNGTETTYKIPLNNYFKYSYTQQIFLASELIGVATISNIAFEYSYSSPSSQKGNVSIYLGHTNKSSFSSSSDTVNPANLQLVYTGPMNCHQGWNTFYFTTPFQYNGTDNLVIAIDDNSGGYDGNSYTFYAHDAGAKRSLYYYSDSYNMDPTNPGGTSASSSVTSTRTNIKISMPCDYTVTCIAPNVYVSGATENSITVNWVPGNTESTWEMEYNSATDTNWVSQGTVSNAPYTINNLQSNTLYNIRLRSVCGGGEYSNWTTLCHLTECGPLNDLPFAENFDTYGTGSNKYIRCWNRINTYSSGSSTNPYITSTRYNGVGSLYFYAGDTSTYNIAITPEFDAAIPINTLKASFMYSANNPTDQLIVGVMTDPNDAASFVAVDTVYPANPASTWVEKEIHFSGYTGGGHYIAFKNEYTTDYAYAYIDSLNINLIPDCARPVHVTSTNATTNSIELSWYQDGTPASWVIEYGPSGFTPGTGTKVTATTNPFTVTGLSHSTGYDFYITAVCGTGDSSVTSLVYSAATSCSAIDALPYVDNFDSYGTGDAIYPLCWDRINTYTSSSYRYPYITSTRYNGVGSLYFYATGSGKYNIAITPEFDAAIPVNTLWATFMYKASNSTDRLIVGVMTSPTDTASFVAVDTVYPATPASTWVEKEVFFNGYTGGGHYIAFKNEYTTANAAAYIDSLTIDLMPTCPRPHHLAVSDATSNSIELGWRENGSASTWEIAYGAPGFNPDSTGATVVTANTNPFTVTGLNSATEYEFYVRATCSSVDVSSWSEGVEAATTMVPVALPYTADFTDVTDSWVLNNGDCANYWTRGTVGGEGALFVTNDGTTPGYVTNKTTVVSAQKLFTVGTADTITITFDVQVKGESSYDYLKMFLSPAIEQYPAYTSVPSGPYYGNNNDSTYAYDFYANGYGTRSNYHYILNLLDSTIHVVAKMPNPNANPTSSSTAQLVFAWKNDNSSGIQPPAIIQNLTVTVPAAPCVPIAELPYFEDFEGYTGSTTAATGVEPDCWELVHEDVAMTAGKRPQLYYGSAYAHSGNYSLRMVNRGIYAMPALDPSIELNTMKLEMYLRQSNAKYQLQVGVWEGDSTFVPVATINNASTDIEYVEVHFSNYTGNGHRIAFRNVTTSTYSYSYNYIDDIVLSEAPLSAECDSIATLPYTENFDGHTESTTAATGIEPRCWELVQEDVAMTAGRRPQLYYGSAYAHSGNYSLRMVNRGIYAMPALASHIAINTLKLEMYLLQTNAKYQLQVGVWEEDSTFTPVALINNATTGVEYVEVDFSEYTGNGHRIAFRNVTTSTYAYSYNYIDDISISNNCKILSLPYTENFDGYTESTTAATGVEPECWELVQEDVAMTAGRRPQLYYGTANAHSGNYSLRMVNRGIYAMPALASSIAINTLKLEMYLQQSNAKSQLQVGVWEGDSTFVPIATINNATTGVEYVEVYFSNYMGNGHRIAFRNTASNNSLSYSYNYLDDIVLIEAPISAGCDSIATLPYTENFDGYTQSTAAATGIEPKCWELVQEDVAMTAGKRPQLYYGTAYAHSGDYSLRMVNRGIYAMPALASSVELNTLKLEMYLRQSNAKYQLQVGVWEGDSAFVPVATIDNATTGLEYVEVDFSNYTGNGHRIAFRNVTTGSYSYSYNYIDDISLSIVPNKIEEVGTGSGTATGDGSMTDDVEIGTPMGVDGFAEEFENLTVYPNPTTGVVNVQWTMNNVQVETVEIHVLDAYGKLVNVVRVQPDETVQIDLSRYARGVYFVKAVADGNVLGVKKVVRS